MSRPRIALLLLALAACGRSDRDPGMLSLATFGCCRPGRARRNRSTVAAHRDCHVGGEGLALGGVRGVQGRRRVEQSPFDMFFAPEGNEQLVQSFGTGFVVRADA